MDTLDFGWKIKSVEEASGEFVGLGSPYGDPPDLQGDVIARGAFKAAIASQPAAGYPLLWCHRSEEPLGTARIEDSAAGLAVNGRLFLEDPAAQRALVHMRGGSVRGLSIGFLPPKGDKVEHRGDGVRVLREIHLLELSVVAIPAAPRAQITSVKSLGDVRHVLSGLRAGDVTDEALSQLREIDAELKRLLVTSAPDETADEALRELLTLGSELRGDGRYRLSS